MKSVLLAAPSSSSGKTVITLGLIRLLQKRGIALCPIKAGPDYIDPGFHQMAGGVPGFNLDCWAMRPALIQKLVREQSESGNMLIIEAMMGLFDGAMDGTGSAAMLAQMLDTAILLIIDCSKMSHSVAAVLHGFHHYHPEISIAGIILNKVGSKRHEMMLRNALADAAIPIVGIIPRHEQLRMNDRHLGLIQAYEYQNIESFIETVAQNLENHLNIEQILALATDGLKQAQERKMDRFSLMPSSAPLVSPLLSPLGNHIAVARDDAFRFAYSHILEGWHKSGAHLSFFSPLADEAPSLEADAIYLPGGYPELYAEQLAASHRFKGSIQQAAERSIVIYGEGGGYMVLGHGLEDAEAKTHEMIGLLPVRTSFTIKKLQLGYRKLYSPDGFLGNKKLRGHCFHYATFHEEKIGGKGEYSPLFQLEDAIGTPMGATGLRKAKIAGSFIHIIDIEE